MAKRCDMCFQVKDNLQAVLPGMPARVCKACNYRLGQSISFLEYHQAVLSYQPPLTKDNPPNPPDSESEPSEEPSVPKRKRRKVEDTP